MPIKEVCTNQLVINAFEVQTISSATTTTGGIIDTAKYDNGIYFAPFCTTYTTGDFLMTIFESAAADMTGATAVADKNEIFADITLDAVTAETSIATPVGIARQGVFGTLRYLRVSIVSTDTPNADIGVMAIANPESRPTPQTI
jgi:hypothetical protein